MGKESVKIYIGNQSRRNLVKLQKLGIMKLNIINMGMVNQHFLKLDISLS